MGILIVVLVAEVSDGNMGILVVTLTMDLVSNMDSELLGIVCSTTEFTRQNKSLDDGEQRAPERIPLHVSRNEGHFPGGSPSHEH